MSIISQGPKEAEILPSFADAVTPDEPTAKEYKSALTTMARAFRHKYPTEFAQTWAQFATNGKEQKETEPKEDPLLKFAGMWKDRSDIIEAIAEARRYSNNRPLSDEEENASV